MYFIVLEHEVSMHENLNLTDIETPINADKFRELLIEAHYDSEEVDYLYEGFTRGFSLEYQGCTKVKQTAPNLKFRVGNKLELWNKMMAEVKDKRFAGPYEKIPFEYFIQSPVGLVPKDNGKKTRLIFHLSYPRTGNSVNAGIPHDQCTVKYPSFDEAVKLALQAGKGCGMAKSDMSRAFRNVPLRPDQWYLLVMKAEHPITGKIYYFIDKCLPFGSSISCAIFQRVSNAVAHIVKFRTKKDLVNYLDDYFFATLLKAWCNDQVKEFLEVCSEINFPVAEEKNSLEFLLDDIPRPFARLQETAGLHSSREDTKSQRIDWIFLEQKEQKGNCGAISKTLWIFELSMQMHYTW